MKHIYSVIFVIFLSVQISMAQEAPDFEITDTEGKVHKLYEHYLDQGKTVVLDLFFVDCAPCNALAPLLQPLYEEWGSGLEDVEFFSLTPYDADDRIKGFKENHDLHFPGAGTDGGGDAALEPYTSGQFGQFFGYPTLVVISPDRSVQFDIWSNNSFVETVELLDAAIEETGAVKPLTSGFEEFGDELTAKVFPNPIVGSATLDLHLNSSTDASLYVINEAGQTVHNIFRGHLTNGDHQLSFDLSNIAPGNYFISFQTPEGKQKCFPIIKVE